VRISNTATTVLLAVSITLASCKGGSMKEFDQGEIHFNITYGGPEGSISEELLPKRLVVIFRGDNILFDIKAPFGNQGIANLSNPDENIYDTYLNMLGLRLSYSGSTGETPPGLKAMEGLEIRYTDKTTEIIGFKCKHAEVSLPSMPDSVFEIWYTEELGIKNPNAANPFSEIDGVLLNFFFFMGNREFIFEAESIFQKEIPEKVFHRREKYKPVSKEHIDKVIINLVN
jgi:hypothetical protein